jgi:hypothetical protein
MEHLDKTFAQGQTLNAADLNDIVSKINEGVDEINILAAENMTDTIYLDLSKTSPSQIVTGDVNGDVIKWIRKNSHRYLVKKTAEGKVTMCQLADGDGTIFAGDGSTAALDGTMGDVMVHVPTFYYREQLLALNKWEIVFSLIDLGEEWIKYDGNQLLGAYEAYVDSSKVYSRSGVASTGNVSQANFKSYARARGAGYTITTWEQHCVMAILFYAEYGNTNSQGIIGSGTDSYEKETGQTDSLGMEDTHAETNGNTMSINFWGLENWWGNKYEFIDNVVVNPQSANGVWRITDRDGNARDVQGATEETANWYYPKSMRIGTHLDMIPNVLGGSSSSSLCDGFYYDPSTSRVVRRSGSGASAYGGCACVNASLDAYSASDFSGARLSFAGEIHIEVDVDAFKAL